MRAIRVNDLSGPQDVELVRIDEPTPGDGQVLIDVRAAGVTFPEVLLTRGAYQLKPDPPFLLGNEIAGVVRSAPSTAPVRAGDRVAALTVFGGFADVAVAGADMVFPLPDAVGFADGAALPLNYLTAHFALRRRGAMTGGDTVLVHGASGGVGTASVQLARAAGATVIAVTSSPEKGELARAAGAQHVVDADGFRESVRELTSGRGVDIVVDPVGGDRFTDSLRSLAPEGRVLVIGFVGGDIPTVKVNRLLLNNVAVVGVGWGAMLAHDPRMAQRQWSDLVPLLETGAIDPPIGHRFALPDASEALTLMDERRAVGKVVLEVAEA